jgi:hypothetical protein
MEASFVLF